MGVYRERKQYKIRVLHIPKNTIRHYLPFLAFDVAKKRDYRKVRAAQGKISFIEAI